MRNLNILPENLPKPIDDGSADHLLKKIIPNIWLNATTGKEVNLFEEFQRPSVLFIYPRAGSPISPNTNPELWDTIPGARGCTPQSCGFRDLKEEFDALDVRIFGLSIQSPEIQTEFVNRNHINFPVLSDFKFELTSSLNLPTFNFEGEQLIKRMCLFIEKGIIEKVFYPVFPPDKNAEDVLNWIRSNQRLVP